MTTDDTGVGWAAEDTGRSSNNSMGVEFHTTQASLGLTSESADATAPRLVAVSQVQLAFLGLSIVCGVALNVFILVAIVPNRRIRSTITNVLLCHLSAISLVTCGLLVWRLVYVTLNMSKPRGRGVQCQIQGYLSSFTLQLSIWTLAALAWDRYQTISSPLRHRTSAKRRRMSVLLCATWLTAIGLSSLPLVFGPGYRYRETVGYCDFPFSVMGVIWMNIVYLVATFYAPCGIIIYCYAQIFKIARWQRQRIVTMVHLVTLSIQAPITHRGTPSSHVGLKGNRASWTICVLLGAFLTCYLPYSVSSLIEVVTSSTRHPLLRMWVVILLQLAPSVNAMVYGARNKVLRDSFLRNVHRKLTEYSIPVPFQNPKPSLPNALQPPEQFRSTRLPTVRSQPAITIHRLDSEEAIPCLLPKAHSYTIARPTSTPPFMLELCSMIRETDSAVSAPALMEDPDVGNDVIVRANGCCHSSGAANGKIFRLETVIGGEGGSSTFSVAENYLDVEEEEEHEEGEDVGGDYEHSENSDDGVSLVHTIEGVTGSLVGADEALTVV